jgi:hypothetical protein
VPFCETASDFKYLALRLKESTNLMPLLAVEISSIQHKREIPRPSESICQLSAPQVDALGLFGQLCMLVFHSHDR